MSIASLSLEQAPPISVPFRFFLSAPLFLLLAALALLAAGPDALQSRWTPALLGITHLLTLGCMGMVMSGAMMQLLPVLAGTPVPNPRGVAWAIHLPLLAGSALLGGGLYSGATLPIILAVPLLAFAFAVFLGLSVYSLAVRAQAHNATTRAMLMALVALLFTIVLGLLLAAAITGLLDLPMPQLAALHVGWGLLGWTALLVIGVAYQVVPMFQLTPPYPKAVARWLGGTLFALLLLWSFHPLLPEPASGILALVAACGLAACVAAFSVITLRLQHKRRRKVPDITMEFWRTGLACLLAASVLWLAGQLSGALADSTFYPLALGILFLVGFALSVIQGMLYKIVSFLVWFHLQGKLPVGKTPNMKDIISDRAARRHWRAHLISLPFCLAAALWPWPWVYAAGGALLLGAALLLANLARASNLYRHALANGHGAGHPEK
ncbi:MAG: hypothetical protein HZC43_01500 [Nitrosomonadales bacterium]|nr:hypothetical protein [Nitrosomonadales bacterium]